MKFSSKYNNLNNMAYKILGSNSISKLFTRGNRVEFMFNSGFVKMNKHIILDGVSYQTTQMQTELMKSLGFK